LRNYASINFDWEYPSLCGRTSEAKKHANDPIAESWQKKSSLRHGGTRITDEGALFDQETDGVGLTRMPY